MEKRERNPQSSNIIRFRSIHSSIAAEGFGCSWTFLSFFFGFFFGGHCIVCIVHM